MKTKTAEKYKKEYLKLRTLGIGSNKIARLMNISKSTAKRLRNVFNLSKANQYVYNEFFDNKEELIKIISCILGDGMIRLVPSKINNYYGAITHSIDNEDYLDLKKEILNNYVSCKRVERKASNKNKTHLQLILKTCNSFKQLYPLMYKDNKKYISKELLKYFNDITLAFLYFDDGSYTKSRNTYRISFGNMELSGIENFIYWLKEKYNIDSSIQSSIGYYNVYIKVKSHKIFEDVIKKYAVKSMFYKLKSVDEVK